MWVWSWPWVHTATWVRRGFTSCPMYTPRKKIESSFKEHEASLKGSYCHNVSQSMLEPISSRFPSHVGADSRACRSQFPEHVGADLEPIPEYGKEWSPCEETYGYQGPTGAPEHAGSHVGREMCSLRFLLMCSLRFLFHLLFWCFLCFL